MSQLIQGKKDDPWFNCTHEWVPDLIDYDLGEVPRKGPRELVVCIKLWMSRREIPR